VLAPLVAYLALPSLAAVLLTIAWRLIDFHEMRRFMRTAPRDDAQVCGLTDLVQSHAGTTLLLRVTA